MGKEVIDRVYNVANRDLLFLIVYSIVIAVSPDVGLKLGGVILWLYLLARWLRYGV